MRNPKNVLESLTSKAASKDYHYQRLYRNLYNPAFFLLAYERIQAKPGNMTAGSDGKTIDGMSMKRIEALIQKLKDFSYQPKPARRTYIPKANGKTRPLGIPSFDDKLVQEVVRMILESIYEPTFCATSHGFRPKRSCHTALQHIKRNYTGVKWFVEGDIKGCFDHVDHHVLVQILRRRIADEHFIGLIWKFLKAGYMENWVYYNTYSGTPQGSLISPILANIYLNELDVFMAEYAKTFNRGTKRKINPAYKKPLDVRRGKQEWLKRNEAKISEEKRREVMAQIMEREFQSQAEISSKSRVDGYDDFIFVNRYGDVQNQGNLNKALRRMMRDCNDEILEKYGADSDPVLLPQFSCHILRHTFATRLCESGANLKFIQSILGHADVSTTMNIYVDVTDALKKKEITAFDDYMTTKLET